MSELAIVFYKIVKHNSKCLICGSPSIQMHHVCPKEKISEVFRIASSGDLKSTIREINKCVPLCDPDHRAVHKGIIPGWMEGPYDGGHGFSKAFAAEKYRPYLQYFSKRHPQTILRFYDEYIHREHDALFPLIDGLGRDIPKSLRMKLVGERDVRPRP